MYVYNALDGSAAWYPPQENNPPGGRCGQLVLGSDRSVLLFTNADVGTEPAMGNALYGITACGASFNSDLLLDLGTPAANGGMAEIEKFQDSADLNDLHELIHLVSLGGRMDHPQNMHKNCPRDMLISPPRSHHRHRCHTATRKRLDESRLVTVVLCTFGKVVRVSSHCLSWPSLTWVRSLQRR